MNVRVPTYKQSLESPKNSTNRRKIVHNVGGVKTKKVEKEKKARIKLPKSKDRKALKNKIECVPDKILRIMPDKKDTIFD